MEFIVRCKSERKEMDRESEREREICNRRILKKSRLNSESSERVGLDTFCILTRNHIYTDMHIHTRAHTYIQIHMCLTHTHTHYTTEIHTYF